MALHHAEKALSQAERMEVLLALVEAQDLRMTVAESRHLVCKRFGVSERLLRRIEREGLDGGWPPL
jgi:hypothetical protein